MTKLSIEYHNAKKNYRTNKPSSRRADGKENNQNETRDTAGKHRKASNTLRPAFDPLVAKKPSPENEPKKGKPNLLLSTDYSTAKLKYKASKSRAKATSARESGESAGLKSANKTPKPFTCSNQTTDDACSQITHTAESGLKLLGLLRPIDNKTYEFGLAKGIEVHLVESIKLCGLRKGLEKSIIDMVNTLCNHLTNREDEINREYK